MNFWYYALLLFSLSFGEGNHFDYKPITHTNSVQIYYFYDSRLPSDIGDKMMFLTESLLSKQYYPLVADGDIIFYKVDLATPAGQTIARRCNIVLTGLVVARRSKIKNLTQNAYQYCVPTRKPFRRTLLSPSTRSYRLPNGRNKCRNA